LYHKALDGFGHFFDHSASLCKGDQKGWNLKTLIKNIIKQSGPVGDWLVSVGAGAGTTDRSQETWFLKKESLFRLVLGLAWKLKFCF
jgi:hypothetical protein